MSSHLIYNLGIISQFLVHVLEHCVYIHTCSVYIHASHQQCFSLLRSLPLCSMRHGTWPPQATLVYTVCVCVHSLWPHHVYLLCVMFRVQYTPFTNTPLCSCIQNYLRFVHNSSLCCIKLAASYKSLHSALCLAVCADPLSH